MEIHTHSFCGISTSKDWQTFLAETDPELHSELMITINQRKGCRANTVKMKEIYLKLYKRGFGQTFEDFVTRRFPWLIKSHNKANPKETPKRSFTSPTVKSSEQYRGSKNHEDLNKHKVFGRYNPSILSFPQKLILAGNPQTLFHRVQSFCRDKLAVDYIIVEDRAYIEYFHPKYAHTVNKIKRESREIHKYRKKLEQDG